MLQSWLWLQFVSGVGIERGRPRNNTVGTVVFIIQPRPRHSNGELNMSTGVVVVLIVILVATAGTYAARKRKK
jgi:hypothetical protein